MRPGVDLYIDDFSLRRCGMDDFRPVARARTDQVRRRIVQVKLGSKGRRVLETSVVRRRTRSKKGKKHGGTAKITMVKHEFPFGAAMKSDCLGNDNCMNFFRKNFNHIVPETGAKWHDEEPNKGDFTGSGDFILEASKKLQYPMRAHCEFWENDSVIQDWVKNLPRDGSEGSLQWAIWDRIKWYTDRYKEKWAIWDRVKWYTDRYKEKADIFDVANEMLHNAWYIDALPCKGGGPCMCDYGPACPNDMNVPNNIDVYSWMYRATSYYAPNRVMALNDFCLTHYCSKHFAMSSMVKEARHIKAATQMGAQGHLNRGRTICGFDLMERFDHAVAAANFKNAGGSLSQAQIMKLKKKIYITEHDVQDTDLSKRADGYETMYRAAYASAGVAGINIWGYRQGDEWRPDIAMVDHDYQLTLEPGQRIFGDKGLLHDEWNSSVKAAKIKGGAVKFKAFPGEYTIQVKGCRGRFTVPVGMGGMSVTVRNWKCKGRRTKRNLKLPQPGEGLVDAGTAADVQVEV
ncbi:glycoside hydrolase superfamily [Tribonema minus]|uniref:Glycoside hydrolase superfamily n=1 Tax=Tribonema minus TaxID=303371 RepID=A0A835YVR5_9STRA|nr:glycoside hydrolase superfamily [Tribonema minus]